MDPGIATIKGELKRIYFFSAKRKVISSIGIVSFIGRIGRYFLIDYLFFCMVSDVEMLVNEIHKLSI